MEAFLKLSLLLLALSSASGFSVSRQQQGTQIRHAASLLATRRSFVESLTIGSGVIASSILFNPIEQASASGGATAGGVYLLSAKQRYNARVTAGVVAFRGIGAQLESGDIDSIRTYFTSEDTGSWKDFSTSAYLLANAFRRSSNTPPESLPSVKKWKAFAAEVENITKSLKKKDTKGALAAHAQALIALDEYLEKVELPPSVELATV